ncbi:MAG: hypothetical protein U5L45_26090 [Saprospiraceae bacterium]|nr:hypothetical protein [Saprospiraceae bacterium]
MQLFESCVLVKVECGSFFGLCPKNEPPPPSSHGRSERVTK